MDVDLANVVDGLDNRLQDGVPVQLSCMGTAKRFTISNHLSIYDVGDSVLCCDNIWFPYSLGGRIVVPR